MTNYRCKKDMCVPACDDDGFTLDNECEIVVVGEVISKSEEAYRFVGAADSIRLESGLRWLEITPESFEECFELADGRAWEWMKQQYIDAAKRYIHSVYCLEQMHDMGIWGIYGLEQQRIAEHEALCTLLKIDREDTKVVCLHMDKAIGFDVSCLDSDYEYYIEKYAVKLVGELARLPATGERRA